MSLELQILSALIIGTAIATFAVACYALGMWIALKPKK